MLRGCLGGGPFLCCGTRDFRFIEHTVIDVSPQVLGSYVGTYSFVKASMQVDHLMAEIPVGSRPQRLYVEPETRFFVLDGPQELLFDRDPQGKTTNVERAAGE